MSETLTTVTPESSVEEDTAISAVELHQAETQLGAESPATNLIDGPVTHAIAPTERDEYQGYKAANKATKKANRAENKEKLSESLLGKTAKYSGKLAVNAVARLMGNYPKYDIHPVRTPAKRVAKLGKSIVFGAASEVGFAAYKRKKKRGKIS